MSTAEALAVFYAAGVVVATVGCSVAAQKLGDQDQPGERLLLWSVIAGVLWPVLLVGIVEMVGVWMYFERRRRVVERDEEPIEVYVARTLYLTAASNPRSSSTSCTRITRSRAHRRPASVLARSWRPPTRSA